MKNRINSIFTLSAVVIISVLLLSSCKKDKIITPNTTASLFASTDGSYFITSDPNTVYKIPLGITRVPDKSVSIQFTVSSPSGAVEGQQYTLATNTITIPAGQTVDSIALNGIFSAYPTGRTDTLIFTITGGDVPALVGSEVFTLVLQKYCDVDLDALLGDYTNTYDEDPDAYGPYTVTVVSATATGPTSAALVIKDFGDYYFGPFGPGDLTYDTGVTVNIDWSDPANFFTTFPTQSLGTIPPYGVSTSRAAATGTFSSCDNTISVSYTTSVAAGSFGTVVTVLSR